jgi:flagella basal body P-ring formation protein FlgA
MQYHSVNWPGRVLLAAAIAALGGLPRPGWGAEPVLQLELQASTSAAGSVVELDDVANYVSGDETLWNSVAVEPLCRAPRSGRSVTLTAQDILGLLQQRGYDWRAIALGGTASVRIGGGGQTVSSEALLALVVSGTTEQLGTGVTVNQLQELPEQQLESGLLELRLRFPDKPGQWLPDAVEITRNEQLTAVVPLGRYVSFTLNCVTALRDIPARSLVSAEQLGQQEVTLPAGSEVLCDPVLASGLATRGSFAPGQRVLLSSLVRPYDVQCGDDVELLLVQGGVQLRAQATALGNAYVGQRLAVRRLSDGTKFVGILGAEQVVEVQ